MCNARPGPATARSRPHPHPHTRERQPRRPPARPLAHEAPASAGATKATVASRGLLERRAVLACRTLGRGSSRLRQAAAAAVGAGGRLEPRAILRRGTRAMERLGQRRPTRRRPWLGMRASSRAAGHGEPSNPCPTTACHVQGVAAPGTPGRRRTPRALAVGALSARSSNAGLQGAPAGAGALAAQ